MTHGKFDPADVLFEEQLYDLRYTLVCLYGEWKSKFVREYKEDVMKTHREASKDYVA